MSIKYFDCVDSTFTITSKKTNEVVTLYGKVTDYTMVDPSSVKVICDNRSQGGGETFAYSVNVTEAQTLQLMVVNFDNTLYLKKFNNWYATREELEVIGVSGNDSTSNVGLKSCRLEKRVIAGKLNGDYITELNFTGSGLDEDYK